MIYETCLSCVFFTTRRTKRILCHHARFKRLCNTRKQPSRQPSDISEIKIENKGDFVNMIVLDMDSYSEKYGNKAVRKNCTIPAWLNTVAEKNDINFSAVLQEALCQKLNINTRV